MGLPLPKEAGGGADVTWQEFPLLEHIGGVSAGGPVAMSWLGTKFFTDLQTA